MSLTIEIRRIPQVPALANLPQDALKKLCKNRTTIIIAHRFSTIINADKIVVIDKGSILDQGRHREIYNRCKYYRELCENQFIYQSN